MKVLITGASGFIGRSLSAELPNHGHTVRVAVRSANVHLDMFERAIISSMDSETDWSAALNSVNIVIHLASRVHVMYDKVADPLAEFRKVNVDGTLKLAEQAAKVGVKRFIFISSIKVNGERTELDRPFTEEDASNPQDNYGLSKHEAELGLLLIAQQTEMEVVIIRPPLVYGPGVKANFASLIKAVKSKIPLPFGAISNKRSFVYVGNLVSLIARCIHHPAAANQIFLVSDGHDISITELLQGCALALGVKPRLLPISQSLIEVCAALLGKREVAQRICGNLQVDISKSRDLLGWSPPILVSDGLKATTRD